MAKAKKYIGKFYADLENADECTISSSPEFDTYEQAKKWAFRELWWGFDNDELAQASIYKIVPPSEDDTAEIGTELEAVLYKHSIDRTTWPTDIWPTDIGWKHISKFPTLSECPDLKNREMVIMTDMGYVFSAFYEGRKGFAVATIRNGKVYYDEYEQKRNIVWWAFTGTAGID